MLYATAFGGELLGYVDIFINQIALLFGVIVECILFAWIFKAEKLIEFLNERSKVVKLGKWWLIIVKYILPIFISIVWIGGLAEVIADGSLHQSIFMIICAVLLIVGSLVFTLLPAKNPNWKDVDERV